MDDLTVSDIQPIVYDHRLVAVCTAEDFQLTERLVGSPLGDPEFAFVMLMVTFARDVLDGRLEGPYTDDRARRYVRDLVIPDALLGCTVPWTDEQAADLVGVPEREIAAARIERRRALDG